MVANKDSTAGVYQCGLCKAEYARADHLVRHVRSHTKQRPFICTVCGKGFARKDLLKRHLTTHAKDASNRFETVAQAEAAILAQPNCHAPRVSQACRSCAAKKVKCTNSKPCERCREHNLHCQYEQRPNSTGGSRAPPQEIGHDEVAMPDVQIQVQEPSELSPPTKRIENTSGRTFDHGSPLDSINAAVNINDSVANVAFHDFIVTHNDAVQDILSSTLTLPEFGNYLDINTDPVLEDIDFTFLDGPFISNNVAWPLQVDTGTSTTTPVADADSMATGVIAEVYRSSRMHEAWDSDREERQDSEHRDLNLLPDTDSECFVPSTQPSPMLRKVLSSSTRDRIFALIFQYCSLQAREGVVKSFPSCQVLGDLIQFALIKMKDLEAISMIHMPSFDLNKQRPELLAALIAYGSICSPSPALRKFGYAIQEAVRVAIIQLMTESRQAVLNQHDICQAFYIQLYLGYWSSIRLKVEMAEGMSMMGTTFLRRGKWLQRQNYHAPEHFLNISGISLNEKWLKWVEQEGRKRLVYFAFTLDAHISASRDTNILFRYSELETPLPSATRLWKAETAVKWQNILQTDNELRMQQPESLCAILRRSKLGPPRSRISDAKCCNLAFLAGVWAFIHEYQSMNTVAGPTNCWNDFVLNARHSELSTGLQQLTARLTDLDEGVPEVLIIQDFVSLHLNVAFYELSKYAGIRTDTDAQLAVPYVQKWFESSHSRAALWHAGQIFRATKFMPRSSLTDIYAVALYHAAVTLWAWGLLSRTQGLLLNDVSHTIALNSDETLETSRFLRGWRMLPGLTTTSGQFVSLYTLTAAPDLAHEIIMSNWGSQPLPLTADEVSRLMQGVSNICVKKFKEVPA